MMKEQSAVRTEVFADWSNSRSVQAWRQGLRNITALETDEVEQRVAVLLEFCIGQDVSPDWLVAECRQGASGASHCRAYLEAARASPANLVVLSFLVHNGINVFGDLVCMPRTAEHLAEQGTQWG